MDIDKSHLALYGFGAATGAGGGLMVRATVNHSRLATTLATTEAHPAAIVALKLRGIGAATALGTAAGAAGGAAIAHLATDEFRTNRANDGATAAFAGVTALATGATLVMRRLPHTPTGARMAPFVEQGLGWIVPFAAMATGTFMLGLNRDSD